MDERDLRNWLDRQFDKAEWTRGVAKDELVRVAQRDQWIGFLAERASAARLFHSPDDVLRAIPPSAWEEMRVEARRRAATTFQPDPSSRFKESPVGQDRSDVYQAGEPAPPTPGFGQSSGAAGESGQPG